jgi:hypothetical protein
LFKEKYRADNQLISPSEEKLKEIAGKMKNVNTADLMKRRKIVIIFASVGIALISLLLVLNWNSENFRGLPGKNMMNSASKVKSIQSEDKNTKKKIEGTSVKFSELKLTKSNSLLTKGEDSSKNMSLIGFDEELIVKSSDVVAEVTILNSYTKEYDYFMKLTKFEPDGKLNMKQKTYVAEARIDKLFYSSRTLKEGDVIKIEFISGILCGDTFELKQNRRYILPLNYRSNHSMISEYEMDDYLSGDITLDGDYAVNYPYAPPIQVTADGNHLFHSQWSSLVNDETIMVIMDDVEQFNEMMIYYGPLMKLRQDDEFLRDFQTMVDKYKK